MKFIYFISWHICKVIYDVTPSYSHFLLFCYVAHSVVYLEMDGITDTSYLTKHWTYGSLGLHNSSPPCWEGRHSLDCCLHAAIGTEKEDGISQETQHVRTSIDRGQPPVMSGGRLICLHITTPSGFPRPHTTKLH